MPLVEQDGTPSRVYKSWEQVFEEDRAKVPNTEIIRSQPWYVSHAETIAQNVVGQILAFVILWAYGIPGSTGWKLQLTFLVVAYIRGYAIRRFFNQLKS